MMREVTSLLSSASPLRSGFPSLLRSSPLPRFSFTNGSRLAVSGGGSLLAGYHNYHAGRYRALRSVSRGQGASFSTFSTSWFPEAGDWDANPNLDISDFSQLPSKDFGVNQHMVINQEFKEALRQILWQFRAPIVYAFAYGSGVFTQQGSAGGSDECHPSAPAAIKNMQQGKGKMIDFIFGVSYSQHWHSLNLTQHRDHYSGLGSLGSYMVSQVQDKLGAGVYFNPYITVNGTLIKYGVVNLDTLCRDLSSWDTLYLAGRLQKPVKILRDHPQVRLANQMNLLSAVRVALLLLPAEFTEFDLYSTIAGMSYMGDIRMSLPAEDPRKVNNIVNGQMANFRRLYAPLIDNLPNVVFADPRSIEGSRMDDPHINGKLVQDMDPVKRGNMVSRLPNSFRQKLYFQYQARYQIPRGDFQKMMEESSNKDPESFRRRTGGPFERRIAADTNLRGEVQRSITDTIRWPSTIQSAKGPLTAGFGKSWRYMREKQQKYKGSKASNEDTSSPAPKESKGPKESSKEVTKEEKQN